MREIKFRAWSKVNKTMSPPVTLNQLITSFVKGGWELDGSLELFQWTGLKDRNGVEIYESDVIRMDDGEEYYDYIVKWHNNGYHYIDIKDGTTDCNLIEPDDLYECEVIGNISENPELLP